MAYAVSICFIIIFVYQNLNILSYMCVFHTYFLGVLQSLVHFHLFIGKQNCNTKVTSLEFFIFFFICAFVSIICLKQQISTLFCPIKCFGIQVSCLLIRRQKTPAIRPHLCFIPICYCSIGRDVHDYLAQLPDYSPLHSQSQ